MIRTSILKVIDDVSYIFLIQTRVEKQVQDKSILQCQHHVVMFILEE